MFGLIRPSGGLLYHWRARRHGQLWQLFRQDLGGWLSEWKVPTQELVLIGPSAGYTLPLEWLQRFTRITAYDVDPLAAWLFKKNHPGLNVAFVKQNMFWEAGHLSLVPLRQLLARHPRSPILFSNILGQVLLEGQATEFEWRFICVVYAHFYVITVGRATMIVSLMKTGK